MQQLKPMKTQQLNLISVIRLLIICLLISPLLLSFSVAAKNTDISISSHRTTTPERAKFLAAKAALQKGDEQSFITLLAQLKNYPLYPYLLSADLEKRIPFLSKDEAHRFLDRYTDTYIGTRFQTKWLLFLAEQKRWDDFLEFYSSNSNSTKNSSSSNDKTESGTTNGTNNNAINSTTNDFNSTALQCLALKAKWQLGLQPLSFQALLPLWMHGQTESFSCENLFLTAIQNGIIDDNQVWAREQLAIDNRNYHLVESLRPFLSENKQVWIDKWLQMMSNRLWITQADNAVSDDESGRLLLIDGLERYADRNPEAALDIWDRVQNRYHFTHEEHQRAAHAIAMALATSGHPAAGKWLASVADDWTDPLFREWRIRTAITQQNWKAVQYWISHLPLSEKNLSIWRYWSARSLEKQGQKFEAQKIYQSLSQRYDYYSVLARAHLHSIRPLVINVKYDGEMTSKNANNANKELYSSTNMGILRARELFYLHMIPDARREWQYTINRMNDAQLIRAAQSAIQWGWFDQAISAANKITRVPALSLRYPLAYQQQVKTTAKQLNLNAAWVYSIIHQESNFASDAKSPAGALGLMQLLPRTAYAIASRLNLRHQLFNSSYLFDINNNILCGANYMDELLRRFHGNTVLATTAYNAGPGQVQKWLSNNTQNIDDADVWIEIIPWRETRNYVKNIIFATAVYEQQLQQTSTLAQLLQPITFTQQKNSYYSDARELPDSIINGQVDSSLEAANAVDSTDSAEIKISGENDSPVAQNNSTNASTEDDTDIS